jgi:hypothetical protein
MIELIPILVMATVEVDGKDVQMRVDSKNVIEVYDSTYVNKCHTKFRFLGTVIRGKTGWMSVVADHDRVAEHRLKTAAVARVTEAHCELGGNSRGSRLG